MLSCNQCIYPASIEIADVTISCILMSKCWLCISFPKEKKKRYQKARQKAQYFFKKKRKGQQGVNYLDVAKYAPFVDVEQKGACWHSHDRLDTLFALLAYVYVIYRTLIFYFCSFYYLFIHRIHLWLKSETEFTLRKPRRVYADLVEHVLRILSPYCSSY